MTIYVAFFRGINVGGSGSLPMKELVAILESMGAKKVKTYIQSGNVVFESAEKDWVRLGKQLTAEILQRRSFEPQAIVLSREALAKAIAENPFPDPESWKWQASECDTFKRTGSKLRFWIPFIGAPATAYLKR